MLRVLSLGAGVQSTTVALMAALGEIGPRPDHAIFADTGAEPAAVYRHLEWLRSPGILPFPVHIVSAGFNLRDELLASMRGKGRRGSDARPPFFVKNPDGTRGILRRQCTGDYKIVPIQKKVRELIGLRPRQRWPKDPRVEQWIGISRDEASRMKDSQIPTIVNRWPLIELGMTRNNCLDWLERWAYPIPPKSACTFCPYHDDRAWRHLCDTDPQGWADALEVDGAIRHGFKSQAGIGGIIYLHSSLQPLADVDLSTAVERGQPNLFNDECEGMCGV